MEDEDRNKELVALHRKEKLTAKALAVRFGVSRQRVYQILSAAGVSRRNGRESVQPPAVVARIVKLRRQNVSLSLIAVETKLSRGAVSSVLRREGVRPSETAVRRAKGRERVRRQKELVEVLQKVAARLGHTPCERELRAAPEVPAHSSFVKVFGSLRAAQRRAGLKPNAQGSPL